MGAVKRLKEMQPQKPVAQSAMPAPVQQTLTKGPLVHSHEEEKTAPKTFNIKMDKMSNGKNIEEAKTEKKEIKMNDAPKKTNNLYVSKRFFKIRVVDPPDVLINAEPEYPCAGTDVIIGRKKEEVDIFINQKTISRKHAIITGKEDGLYLIDNNATAGTYIMVPILILQQGVLFEIGIYRLEVKDCLLRNNEKQIVLEIADGPTGAKGQQFRLSLAQPIVIGSASQLQEQRNAVYLNDLSVDDSHARIVLEGETVYLLPTSEKNK